MCLCAAISYVWPNQIHSLVSRESRRPRRFKWHRRVFLECEGDPARNRRGSGRCFFTLMRCDSECSKHRCAEPWDPIAVTWRVEKHHIFSINIEHKHASRFWSYYVFFCGQNNLCVIPVRQCVKHGRIWNVVKTPNSKVNSEKILNKETKKLILDVELIVFEHGSMTTDCLLFALQAYVQRKKSII